MQALGVEMSRETYQVFPELRIDTINGYGPTARTVLSKQEAHGLITIFSTDNERLEPPENPERFRAIKKRTGRAWASLN